MANLQIKSLPDHVHEELRRRARAEGTTIRAYVLRLILRDQALPPRTQWLAQLDALRPVEPSEPVADLVAQDRAERDAELARRANEGARA